MIKHAVIALTLLALISCEKQVCENIGPLDNPKGAPVVYEGSYVTFRYNKDSMASGSCSAWFIDTVQSVQSFRRIIGAMDDMRGFLEWDGINSTRTIERKPYYSDSPGAVDFKTKYGLCEHDFIISEHAFTYNQTEYVRWVGDRDVEKIIVYLSPDQKQLNMIRIFHYNRSGIGYIFKGHAK